MEFSLDYKLFKYLYSIYTCIYYLTAPKPFNVQLFLSYYITDPHKVTHLLHSVTFFIHHSIVWIFIFQQSSLIVQLLNMPRGYDT